MARQRVCERRGCGGRVYALGVCRRCYQRARRARLASVRRCAVDGYGRPVRSRGLRNRHYAQARESPGFRLYQPRAHRVCGADGCSDRVHAKGLCRKHYFRRARRKAAEAGPRAVGPDPARTGRLPAGYGAAGVCFDVWMARQLAAIRGAGTGPAVVTRLPAFGADPGRT